MAAGGQAYAEHFHVYDEMRSMLRSGRLAPGTRFIPTDLLPTCYAKESVERAVAMLQDEGLLNDSPGEEVQVAQRRTRSRRGVSFAEDHGSQGRSPSERTLVLGLAVAQELPEQAKNLFDVDHETFVHHLRIQRVDGVPHAVADSYVPLAWCRDGYHLLRDGGTNIYTLLRSTGHRPTRIEESLVVDSPTTNERVLLDLLETPSVPVVRLVRLSWSGGDLAEYCSLCDRSDLYEFHYVFETTGRSEP